MIIETTLFYVLAGVAIFAALALITRISPLMSALWLVVCLLAVAGIFALLSAPLIAALQVLISAGAVMVLFIFVVMLVDLGREGLRPRVIRFGKALGAIAAGYLAFVLALAILKPPFTGAPKSGDIFESPLTVGELMLGKFVMPFEIAGLMLLVAAVAAIVLAKKPGSGIREQGNQNPGVLLFPDA